MAYSACPDAGMNIYYDTEFWESGPEHPIFPISIGMVRADGEEYYAVVRDAPWAGIVRQPWLRSNVLPYLPFRMDDGGWELDTAHPDVKTRTIIAHEIRRFVLGVDRPRLWAGYAQYDHVVLAQLFGRMVDLPTGFPMRTNDVMQEHERVGSPPLPQQTGGAHHALEDARHLRTQADYLAKHFGCDFVGS